MLAVIPMSNISRSSVVLEAEPEAAPHREVDADTPFRILILGDFSGRANRGLSAGLAGRRPTPVDLDNFDEVMEEMQPTLRLPGAHLRFRELDDFHPDHLHRDAAIFQKLADLQYEPPRAAAAAAAPIPVRPGLLDSILDQTDDSPAAGPSAEEGGDLAEFIRKVMAPHLEEKVDPGKKEWAARIQAVTGEQMRAILHHPDFQALEAAWRAAWMVVQGLADDARIYLLDATLEELMADTGALQKILTGPREPWALLVGNFAFGETEGDARRLLALGQLARAAGAPFLAEGQPPSGEPSPEHWRQLRQSAVARYIGLTVPRFLVRLPYGKKTSPVESFEFEEMKGSVHAEYLWGNPAFCCAYLLGQSFRSDGWDLRPGSHRNVTGLPLHVYESDGGHENKPCAEILLSEKDAAFLMECGYMPLASMKDQDSVLLVRFQSIADPLAALAGRWS
jgi:type VI secretion system protein ImpC